jgi:hypothetical protein
MDDDYKVDRIVTKSMTVLDHTTDRFFEGYLTVEMKDKQGEITVVDELYKCLPIWMDRGAPITDTHSNRVVGKGINFMKTTYESEGVTYPAIKITGKIHKDYELDADIWRKIKSGEYKGLSFGGATKTNRTPKVMKDGTVAYELTDLEHYEVAVCRDPAVPLALITDYNPLAKALTKGEDIGNGKMKINCDKFGCYVPRVNLGKGDDFSNADLTTGTSTQDIDSGGMGKKLKPTKLDGGLPDLKTANDPIGNSAGSGIRGLGDFESANQKSPEDQTAQVTSIEEKTKIVGAILAGAGRALAGAARVGAEVVGDVAEGAAKETVDQTLGTDLVENTDKTMTYRDSSEEKVGMLYPEEGEEVWDSKQQKQVKEDKTPKRNNELESKSGYQTEAGNNQLGGQGVTYRDPDPEETNPEQIQANALRASKQIQQRK